MMAKLSDRQKNNILAKWHTGQYTKIELAKAYKISEAMVRKICGNEQPKNSDIVEAGVIFEKAKKCGKSASEISAIDNAVKYRLEKEYNADKNKITIFDSTAKVLKGINELLDKGKSQKVTTANLGEGIVEANVIEIDLQAIDYKNAMETIDKASINLEVAQRHANTTINNTNANQRNTKYVGFVPMSEERKKEIMAQNGRN